ncbi:hypothetical protein [Haloferula sp.]|uniref:hypothetical protein n=1 Tax=Haloferula sp. TaxID=2497595 RepID=UPI00329AE5E3
MLLPLHPALATLCVLFISCIQAQVSSLVYPGPDGKLDYSGYANEGQVSNGNLMIDFSRAGYGGGGVAIPWVPVVLTLNPVGGGGDDYARIQAAIDTVAAMPLSPAGFRGTLLLTAGTYNVSQTLTVTGSGVVIRGEGQGPDGTILHFTATVQDHLIQFGVSSGWTKVSSTESAITDVLVPCGASSFNVASTSGFSVGDRIIVHRTPNQAWIDELDMGQWGWTASGYNSTSPRTITAIDGSSVTLDAPLVHAVETQYGGGEVYRYHFNGAIRQAGIERIRLESSFTSDTDEDHGWDAVQFKGVENSWARQVTARYFGHSCVFVDDRSQHVTVEDCAMLDPKSLVTGSRRYSFHFDDSCYVLAQRCYTSEGRHDYVTGSKMGGPSVFVDSLSELATNDIGPHHRYAEGVLFDNIKGNDEINVQNRADSGTGHGWSGTQTVFWNCEASSLICDAPKAAMNFAIGCVGTQSEGSFTPSEPFGFWESHGIPVTPRSLYYKQLEDRLGLHAVKTVTTAGQLQGRIWNTLSLWGGDSEAPDLPAFEPLQVEAGADETANLGTLHPLNAVVRYPLPSNFPVTNAGWTKVSGPGAVTFGDATALSTTAAFDQAGSYELQFAISQDDDSDPGDVITYNGSDTLMVEVRGSGSFPFEPADFTPIGTVTSATPALTIDTDSLQVSGGLTGTGELVDNGDGTFVAVFAFLDFELTTSPIIVGSQPLVFVSQGDLRIVTDVVVKGGNGAHTTHGMGIAGGGDGGDANRTETSGNPFAGQGQGGSVGNASGNEDSSSGGGGFGGAGGSGTSAGGEAYGDQFLTTLIGGSGAGGTRNKGGGAGGGGIGFVASGNLELTSGAAIDARGGNGSSSGAQFTSGGGSGGAIFLFGKNVVLNGELDAGGGNGGNASGSQLNGGGGGGGRVAAFYQTSLDTTGSSVTVSGGLPVGTNPTGQPGADGTVYYGLNNAGLADQWLTSETGISEPGLADWLVDYDDDSLNALLEYVFGGSTSTSDSSLLPKMVPNGEDGFDVAFNRRQSGMYPSDYMVETSTSLEPGDWDPLVPDESRTVPHPSLSGFEQVLVPLPTGDPRRFARIQVVLP